jgi:tetracycline 7-halogenase / FADH2 O2-dependent halogenase
VVTDFDLAIVGSGFGGSILATIARRLGRRVVLLERGRHPRFAIGESASPLAGLLIEALADRYDLPRLRPLGSYGAWKRHYPQVTCGLKRGFTYFKHGAGRSWEPRPDRANELLVAASPNDNVSDTQWYRAEVDHFLVEEAVAAGAEYLDRVTLERLAWLPSGAAALTGTRDDQPVQVSAHSVVDASGPHGFLSRALGLAAPGFDDFPNTQALFSHFRGVMRCGDLGEFSGTHAEGVGGDVPPYLIDDAALHHVFDGGWMWVLRFENGITSAGVAVTDTLARDLRLADGGAAWHRLLARYPTVASQFAGAEPVREYTWMPRLAFRVSQAADERWALLPSAAAFVDPLFSTGIPLTLLGIERLAALIEDGAFATRSSESRPEQDTSPSMRRYSAITLAEADQAARFVAGCYDGFGSFEDFTVYSMFYFAAASYAEMARRLGVSGAGFLGLDAPAFAGALRALSPATLSASPGERGIRIARALEPWNVAGLCDTAKRNWYGVDLEDTVRAASKLGVTEARVRVALTLAKGGLCT